MARCGHAGDWREPWNGNYGRRAAYLVVAWADLARGSVRAWGAGNAAHRRWSSGNTPSHTSCARPTSLCNMFVRSLRVQRPMNRRAGIHLCGLHTFFSRRSTRLTERGVCCFGHGRAAPARRVRPRTHRLCLCLGRPWLFWASVMLTACFGRCAGTAWAAGGAALTKTALALLGPLQSDEELQEVFSVSDDQEQRLRTLLEELRGPVDTDSAKMSDDANSDDAEGSDEDDDNGDVAHPVDLAA